MKPLLCTLFAAWLLGMASPVRSQLVAGSLDVRWNEGAEDCAADPPPPIQVHAYEPQTMILRENPCATFEAPFVYLLIGADTALLIDTGAVEDPQQMPLAQTVMALLPGDAASKMPLIVVHTHGHQDHRAGDPQFENLPNVRLIHSDLDDVRRYFGFPDWPNGSAQIDLGDRTVDVIPTPGHHPAHLAFYDRRTGLVLSGDFLLPGRLIIDDIDAYRDSARRLADFLADRPVSHVLGAHIELDADDKVLPYGSHYHPRERVLQLTKDDLLALPAALSDFNGFYAKRGIFILSNPIHNLAALGSAAILALAAIGLWLRRHFQRRRARFATG